MEKLAPCNLNVTIGNFCISNPGKRMQPTTKMFEGNNN